MRPPDPPRVSIVVAAYNESRHIGSCLRTLLLQTVRPLEIVVVDDGSRDQTYELASSFQGVTVLRQAHSGAAAARNLGAAYSSGQILVFLDADMTFPESFVDRLIAPLLEGRARATFTKDIRVANGARRWARAHQLGRGLPPDNHFEADFPERWQNFRALWKEEFVRVGGFDEVGHGEDMTLGAKLGYDAQASPRATCYHFEPETLGDIFVSARWVGRGERIKEVSRPLRVYGPRRSLARAIDLGRRHAMPSLFIYRLVWDAGVIFGWLTRHRASAAK